MAEKSTFTEAQIRQLNASPYVQRATRTTVSFTSAFKELFYEQQKNGLTPEEIFQANGIDPEILGSTRIRGFAQRLQALAARGDGFADLRCRDHSGTDSSPPDTDAPEGKADVRKLTRDVRTMFRQTKQMIQEMDALQAHAERVMAQRDALLQEFFPGQDPKAVDAALWAWIHTRPRDVYPRIHAALMEEGEKHTVAELCREAGVSPSGYYAWRRRHAQ